MLIYILKFSACLFIFLLFYKLVLENERMHQFKRFYLLAILALSFGIPLVTFTQYVEPQTVLGTFESPMMDAVLYHEVAAMEPSLDYTPIILWSIYSIGVILFFVKFCVNISQLVIRIKRNPKHKSKGFIKVLLQDLAIPHTFFSYIFLNKSKYENNEIPKEVLLHEETHASQKHSFDIIAIELLQMIFWFNPLIYITKHAIKLNHEFLADEAVLNKGIQPSTYQQLLLAFSSNATEPQLANAINYSSIKKRFTVMKTHTSKQKIWLRSLLLLPLLAFTLYGFSARKEVEKQPAKKEKKLLQNSYEIPILEITFNPDVFKLNGKETSLLKLKEDFVKATKNEKSDLDIRVIGGINMSLINQIMVELKGHLIKINLNEEAYIIGDDITHNIQQKATPEEVEEYNKLSKHYNSLPEDKRFIMRKQIVRIEYLYKRMSQEQKAHAEPFPNFPPPPTPDSPIKKTVVKGKDWKDIEKILKDEEVPPPPSPKSPLDHIIEMAKKGAVFFYEGKSISSDEAIKLLKKNDELNIQTKQSDSKNPKVYISKEPITIKD